MNTLFFRLLDAEDKGTALQAAVATLPQNPTPEAFAVNPESFEQVPGAPFAYWVTDRVRKLFTNLEKFTSEKRVAKQGLATGDDFRYVRMWSEIYPDQVVIGTSKSTAEDFKSQTFVDKEWVAFAKGGGYSKYYSDIHLVVQWKKDGCEIRNFSNPKTGYIYSRYRGADSFYFQAWT
jgi:hypothetical protein